MNISDSIVYAHQITSNKCLLKSLKEVIIDIKQHLTQLRAKTKNSAYN